MYARRCARGVALVHDPCLGCPLVLPAYGAVRGGACTPSLGLGCDCGHVGLLKYFSMAACTYEILVKAVCCVTGQCARPTEEGMWQCMLSSRHCCFGDSGTSCALRVPGRVGLCQMFCKTDSHPLARDAPRYCEYCSTVCSDLG
jgi:hypothetical protein